MSITGFISPFVFQLDRLLLGSLRGASAVGLYVIPFNLVQRLLVLPSSLHSALFPEVAASDEGRRLDLQGRALDSLTALVTPAANSASLFRCFLAWLGQDIATASALPGAILALGFWNYGVTHAASTYLMGSGRPDIISKLLLAYLLPYLGAAYLLIQEFGLVGAAVAWMIRAGFEPILFRWTPTPRSALIRMAVSFLLVSSMTFAVAFLSWRDATYWVVAGLGLSGSALCNTGSGFNGQFF